MTPRDDLALVRRLLAHDGEAWREFVVAYERLVLARIHATAEECHVGLQPSDVDDLSADVFSELLRDDMASLRRFEGRSRLSTWLAVIARRVCLRSLRPSREAPLHDAEPVADERPVVDGLVAVEEAARFEEHLAALDERDRALLELVYEEGLSYRDVAERLGVAVNSVGPLLQRARRRLRRLAAESADRFVSRPTPLA